MSGRIGAGFILDWGCPANVERLLVTIKGTARVIGRNGEHPTPCRNGRKNPYKSTVLSASDLVA